MMLPYFLILIAFIGGFAFIIDVTAGERERQSLEPLLATPSSRGAIMTGKILASCILGIVSVAVTLIAFKLGFEFGPSAGVKVNVSTSVVVGILIALVPMVLIGACLVTLIAAGAKSVKEAQSYISGLILLPIIPTMVLLVNPVKNQLWMMATPFLSQNQVIMRLLRSENVSALEWVVYLVANLGLAGVLWALAARRYHDERLAISP
jgi:sodium transport system permease protein